MSMKLHFRKDNIVKKLGIGILAGALVFLIIISVFPSLFTVQTGEVATVRRFGVVEESVGPGLHFRLWFIHSIDRYDITVRQISFDFTAYSVDAQNVQGSVAIQYMINPESVVLIAEQFGRIYALEQRLYGIMMQEVQNVIAWKSAMEIVETRPLLSQEIHMRLSEIAGQFHITVTAVALESIIFSTVFEQAVEQRMIAEQAMMQAEFERDRAIVLAEQQREVAAIEAEATLLKAGADAQALRIMQDAWGDLADTVKDAMLRQLFFENWDGVLPHVVAGDQLGIIMDGLQ